MDKDNKLEKGEHEDAMVQAKDMLDSGCGIVEIINATGLSVENVYKAMRNIQQFE